MAAFPKDRCPFPTNICPLKLKLGEMHFGVFLQEADPNWALLPPAHEEGPFL